MLCHGAVAVIRKRVPERYVPFAPIAEPVGIPLLILHNRIWEIQRAYRESSCQSRTNFTETKGSSDFFLPIFPSFGRSCFAPRIFVDVEIFMHKF